MALGGAPPEYRSSGSPTPHAGSLLTSLYSHVNVRGGGGDFRSML